MHSRQVDVIIIGGGQSGLATGYFLRRTGLSFIILDEQENPGGAWLKGWNSLRLFSPAEHSSLPGWLMPRGKEEYPGRDEVIDYLTKYEERYKLPVERPVKVSGVEKIPGGYKVVTNQGEWQSKAVISATGSWSKPYIPLYPGVEDFKGLQLHSAFYRSPESFHQQQVLIIGGGNSGAQILAEVSKVAQTTWVTLAAPVFLPDEIDGRYLFEFATTQYKAKLEGRTIQPVGSLGDVVMVASVKEARSRKVLSSRRPFERFTPQGVRWSDGTEQTFDAVIWCTGFKAATDHLLPLGVVESDGKITTQGTRSVKEPGLWLVGYGTWTGYASATLIGVGRTARSTAAEVQQFLAG